MTLNPGRRGNPGFFHLFQCSSFRLSDFLTAEDSILTANMERSKAHLDNALPEMVRELGYQVPRKDTSQQLP